MSKLTSSPITNNQIRILIAQYQGYRVEHEDGDWWLFFYPLNDHAEGQIRLKAADETGAWEKVLEDDEWFTADWPNDLNAAIILVRSKSLHLELTIYPGGGCHATIIYHGFHYSSGIPDNQNNPARAICLTFLEWVNDPRKENGRD